jgi:transposase
MVANFKNWLAQARGQFSAKSPTGEALKYNAKYLDGLILFLIDGWIEMDNNTVERTIWPIAIGRKNSLFAGLEAGAQNWAVLASLIETCKLNWIEPHSYLTRTLTAIVNGHQQSQISKLLPWGYTQTV